MPSSKLKNKPAPKAINRTLRLQFEAIGTIWEISADQEFSKLETVQLLKQVLLRIEDFDKNYSRFRADSLVTQMAERAGNYSLPADARPLFDIYQTMERLTNGLMTPLIGQMLSDAGYDASYSLRPTDLKPTPAWESVLEYRYPTLTLSKPALLDFGAAGKGYLVDIITKLLRDHGISDFVINAGGDIMARQSLPESIPIALEDPDQTDQAIGIASIINQSICSSAGNRRSWAGYNHILNPSTMTSPDHIKAVWVIADEARIADALTSALYFVTPAVLLQEYDFHYALLFADRSLVHSVDFPAEFFK